MNTIVQNMYEEKELLDATTTTKKFFTLIKGISDTHYTDIEIQSDEFVRGGILKNIRIVEPPVKFSFQEIVELVKFLHNGNNKQELKLPLSFSFSVKGFGHYRVQVLRERHGIIMTLRRLSYVIPDYDVIGVPEYLVSAVLKSIGAKKNPETGEVTISGGQRGGLILVTGPMGSGKTTTIASVLKFVGDNIPMVILTIEDPIEYVHSNARGLFKQLEVPTHVDSQEGALYHALRSNAGIIFLGEVRSSEELKKLLTASEYGTLTMTSFHVPDCVGAIERIAYELDSKVTRKLLASTLIGVVNQRLIYTVGDSGKPDFYLVCEWLPVNTVPAIQEFIEEQKFSEIRQGMARNTWASAGAVSLEDSLRELRVKGVHHNLTWAGGIMVR